MYNVGSLTKQPSGNEPGPIRGQRQQVVPRKDHTACVINGRRVGFIRRCLPGERRGWTRMYVFGCYKFHRISKILHQMKGHVLESISISRNIGKRRWLYQDEHFLGRNRSGRRILDGGGDWVFLMFRIVTSSFSMLSPWFFHCMRLQTIQHLSIYCELYRAHQIPQKSACS